MRLKICYNFPPNMIKMKAVCVWKAKLYFAQKKKNVQKYLVYET